MRALTDRAETVQGAGEEAGGVGVRAAADESGVLSLVDEKGRRVIVPVAKLAYVEIDESVARKVGFTAS